MTLPYTRKFNKGRQSEQFYNEELHQIHTALKNINYRKNENKGAEPSSILDGALWFDKVDNQLKYWDMPTRTWKCVFSSKFQITDQITNIFTPSDPVEGQLWISNGVLMYFDGSSWQTVKALLQDDTQWANSAFENFQLVSPLNCVLTNAITGKTDDVYTGWNREYISDGKWNAENYSVPELEFEPEYEADNTTDYIYQYIIPNLNTDKVFVGNDYDENYEELSKISFQYKKSQVHEERVSGIHFNPGRLTNIKKQIFYVDKENPTIDKSAYNTEFYGFRRGEMLGDFLLPSTSQNEGNYVTSGDKIILNKTASENYDYVVSITYEFTWVNSNGKLEKHGLHEDTSSFYIVNLQSPVAVHVDGLQLEEASYSVDLDDSTITVDENVDDYDVDIWSPYKKQYGYIRRTEPVTSRAIIHIHEKISAPENVLVFVAGQLIHPVYGGLEFNMDKRNIYVTNPNPEVDNMINMPWCVVDMATDEGTVYDYMLNYGVVEASDDILISYDTSKIQQTDGIILFVNGLLICSDDIERNDVDGTIKVSGLSAGMEYVLLRDPDHRLYNSSDIMTAFNVGVLSDSIIYLNGKLILNDDCFSTLSNESQMIFDGAVHNEIKCFITDEYNNVKHWKIFDIYEYSWLPLDESEDDTKQRIAADCAAISTAYTNLLCNLKIKMERTLDSDNSSLVKSYLDSVKSSYVEIEDNKIVETNATAEYLPDGRYLAKKNKDSDLWTLSRVLDDDDITIYALKYANTVSGYYTGGTAVRKAEDEENGRPVYSFGSDSFSYGLNNLNVYKNGIKLINNVHYQELMNGYEIEMLCDVDEDELQKLFNVDENGISLDKDEEDNPVDNIYYKAWKKQTGETAYYPDKCDVISYIIEPIENGETVGYEQVILSNDNAVQPNIYKLSGETTDSSSPELYPGRLTVYVDGIRLSNKDWTLIDNKHIMLNFGDFIASSETADNYENEYYINGSQKFNIKHKYPDYIVVEIRKDYDRKENTITYKCGDGNSLYLDQINVPIEILDTADEIIIYWNGQYTNLSRKTANDYRIDKYKGCITFLNSSFLSAINSDNMLPLLNNNNINLAWQKQTDKEQYESDVESKITLVWRT